MGKRIAYSLMCISLPRFARILKGPARGPLGRMGHGNERSEEEEGCRLLPHVHFSAALRADPEGARAGAESAMEERISNSAPASFARFARILKRKVACRPSWKERS